jgi:hypothetical protein
MVVVFIDGSFVLEVRAKAVNEGHFKGLLNGTLISSYYLGDSA